MSDPDIKILAAPHAQQNKRKGLSLLNNLSGLGIGLPMKIATDDF